MYRTETGNKIEKAHREAQALVEHFEGKDANYIRLVLGMVIQDLAIDVGF